jgi:hypothetical protein
MNGKFWLTVGLFSFSLVLALWYVGYYSDPKGTCIDNGGCYDSIDNKCRNKTIQSELQLCLRKANR